MILVHTSTKAKIRQRQWEELVERRQFWGDKWIIGGDFHDIKAHEEKNGGRKILESSFVDFRNFIADMNMGEIKSRGGSYNWTNNREGEGVIQEKLDRFFGSADWLLQLDKVSVQLIMKQTSDHAMLLLNTQPEGIKAKSRFIFEAKWTKMQEIEDLIKGVWEQNRTDRALECISYNKN